MIMADWESVLNSIRNETAAPTDVASMATIMPDGRLRGTRNPATLYAEARNAKARGDREQAFEWLLLAKNHDADAQEILRAHREDALNAI
jgi:hypothetical protein